MFLPLSTMIQYECFQLERVFLRLAKFNDDYKPDSLQYFCLFVCVLGKTIEVPFSANSHNNFYGWKRPKYILFKRNTFCVFFSIFLDFNSVFLTGFQARILQKYSHRDVVWPFSASPFPHLSYFNSFFFLKPNNLTMEKNVWTEEKRVIFTLKPTFQLRHYSRIVNLFDYYSSIWKR